MLFGIDVRRRIVRPNDKWMEYVDLKSHVNILKNDDDETNSEILEKLEEISKIMDEVESIKRQEVHDAVKLFEQDFVKDVKENPFLYGLDD